MAERSASPFSFGGVPTQMKIASPDCTASAASPAKERRFACRLKAGVVPIYEPHLDALLTSNLQAKRLSFAGDAADAVQSGEAIFICVGTPPKENGEADLSAIDNVARLIATEAHSSKLVIEKSTVPAQTGQQLRSEEHTSELQ